MVASGKGIRERCRLRKLYGGRRWRKLKGTAVELADGTMCYAELHLVRGARCRQKRTKDQANSGNSMKRSELQFAVYVKNKNYGAALESRKLCRSRQMRLPLSYIRFA